MSNLLISGRSAERTSSSNTMLISGIPTLLAQLTPTEVSNALPEAFIPELTQPQGIHSRPLSRAD